MERSHSTTQLARSAADGSPAGRPSWEPGLLIYVLVENVERTLEIIREAGGELVTPLTPQGEGEAFATFRDPAGNVLGIGQQP